MENEVAKKEVLLTSRQIAPGEIIIGTLVGIDQHGKPLVQFDGNLSTDPVVAISTVSLSQENSGRQVALLFANGDMYKPVVIGLIHSPLEEILNSYGPNDQKSQLDAVVNNTQSQGQQNQAQVDGKKVVLEGKDEVVLKCGESSITLTKSGKILIRGKYISSRSSGVNRLLGASIQLN